MVRVERIELSTKQSVHIPARLNPEGGKFRSEPDLFPVAVFQGPSEEGLTCPQVVRNSRVDIVDALVNCVSDLSGRPFLIDLAASGSPFLLGKAHTPKTENGNLICSLSHFSVKHCSYLLLRIDGLARKASKTSLRISSQSKARQLWAAQTSGI